MNGNELAAWEGHGDLITSVCITHDKQNCFRFLG